MRKPMIKKKLLKKYIDKGEREIININENIDSASKAGLCKNVEYFLQKKVMIQKELVYMKEMRDGKNR